MDASPFVERLADLQRDRHTDLALYIAPRLARLPLVVQRYDDPFLPFGKAIIAATRAVVCAYIFDLAAYLAIGAAGAVALERTIAYAGGDTLTILHGPFAGPDYTVLLDEGAFRADALTLVSAHYLSAYRLYPGREAFVVCDEHHSGQAAHGWYNVRESQLILPYRTEMLRVRIASEDVLYSGIGEDFATQVLARLEAMR